MFCTFINDNDNSLLKCVT